MDEEPNPKGWIQPDRRSVYRREDCKATRQEDTRGWHKSVVVPDGMRPVDLIRTYGRDLPLPPFLAGRPVLNKHQVECIASAMIEPSLRWQDMYCFEIAPYVLQTKSVPTIVRRYGFDPAVYAEAPVLISGHHRFLAFLLSGAPPSEACPLRIVTAPLAATVFPWEVVQWR